MNEEDRRVQVLTEKEEESMRSYSIRRVWSSWGIWDNLRCAWAFGRKMFPTKAAARRALTFANKANDKTLDKY